MKTYRIRYKNDQGVLVTAYIQAANEQDAAIKAGVKNIAEIIAW